MNVEFSLGFLEINLDILEMIDIQYFFNTFDKTPLKEIYTKKIV